MGVSSQVKTFSPISIFKVELSPDATVDLDVKEKHTALIYVLAGAVGLQNSAEMAVKGQMIQFDRDGDLLSLHTSTSLNPVSLIILAGQPLNQPLARYGPFVAIWHVTAPSWPIRKQKSEKLCLATNPAEWDSFSTASE